jgi:hypothetical protein
MSETIESTKPVCRLPDGLVLVAPPRSAWGNKIWEPRNKLANDLIGLLSVGNAPRENFSEKHLEKLTAIGYTIEAVFPNQERGVSWEVTK